MISEEKLTQKFSIWGFVSWPLKKKEGNHYVKGCLLLRRRAPKSGKCGGVAWSLLFFSNHGIWRRATRPAPLSVACRPVLSQIPFFAGGQQHIWRKKRRRKLFFFLPFWREKKSRPRFCPLLPPSGDVQGALSSFRGNCIRFWDCRWQQSAHCLFPLPPYFRGGGGRTGNWWVVIGRLFWPQGWDPSSSIRVFLSQNSQKWEFRKCVKIFIPLHSKESGPESMNQEICPLAFIPESITHTHRHRLPFFFLFRPQMDTFPVLPPSRIPTKWLRKHTFFYSEKNIPFWKEGRGGFFFFRVFFFCGSGPTGIRGEMEQKRSVFFSGPTLRVFLWGILLPSSSYLDPEKRGWVMQTFPIGICRKSQTDRIRFAFFASLPCVSISENGGRNFF